MPKVQVSPLLLEACLERQTQSLLSPVVSATPAPPHTHPLAACLYGGPCCAALAAAASTHEGTHNATAYTRTHTGGTVRQLQQLFGSYLAGR